jgi:hypothetical protein
MQELYYVDGVCGSGKTEQFVKWASEYSHEKRILLVQPTKLLIQETIKRLNEANSNIDVISITSDNSEKGVIPEFLEVCKQWQSGIICITHAAFARLPDNFVNKSNIEVVVDEIPAVDWHWYGNFPASFGFFWGSLRFDSDEELDNYRRVYTEPGYGDLLEEWRTTGRNDDLLKHGLSELAEYLLSPYWHLYMPDKSWTSIEQGLNEEKDFGQIHIHGLLQPDIMSGFKSLTIMGANFKNSLLFNYWCEEVKFIPHPVITTNSKHPDDFGERVRIHYCSEHWAKKTLDKINADNPFEQLVPDFEDIFKKKPFVWVANNRYADKVIPLDYAERMPTIVHGRNDWSHYNNVLFMSALNRHSAHINFLKKKTGISPERQQQAMAYEIAYQSIMRTSLRLPNKKTPVNVIVGDRQMAYYLHEIFRGGKLFAIKHKVAQLQTNEKKKGAPRKEFAKTNAQRVASHKKRKKVIKSILGPVTKNGIIDTINCYRFNMSFVESILSREVTTASFRNWDEFASDVLQPARFCFFKKKDDNILVFPSEMNGIPDTEGKCKGLSNIVRINCIFFDLDNSELDPSRFKQIFHDFKWIAYNSWSNGSKPGLRYRVFIPFSHPVPVEVYYEIWDLLKTRIEEYGYYVGLPDKNWQNKPASGLDVPKRTPAAQFYLPCKPATNNPEHEIWIENWDEHVDILQPKIFIAKLLPENEEFIEKEPITNANAELKNLQKALTAPPSHEDPVEQLRQLERAVERADKWWFNNCSVPEQGNHNFYVYALKLKKTGIPITEIENKLRQQCGIATHPSERRQQIPSIMSTLRKK